MNEDALLKRMKNRDETALEELISEYESYIQKTVSRILLPYMTQEDVKEVVNDSFYSLWTHTDGIDLEKGSIKAYLTVISRNAAKNKFREYKGEVPLQENDSVEIEDMYEQMERKERAAILKEALSCLKAEEKEILMRYYYLYQSTGEIAEMMELSVNTVKSKLRRGRRKLEKHLQERGIYR